MSETELVRVNASELILPKPKNKGAEMAGKRIAAIVAQLPPGVDHAAWAMAALTEANNIDATPVSVATCVFNLAFLGLMPGKTLGHAHFVPFKGQAQLIVGYKGWIHLAYGTGFLQSLFTDVICQGEPLEYWIDEHGPHFRHTPAFERTPERNNIIGAYCQYKTRDGGNGFRLINRNDIRKSDKGRDVWNSNFEAQVRKTAVLRAAPMWNTTNRLARAIELDEQYEREESQSLPIGMTFDGEAIPAAGYKLPLGDE